MMMMMMVVVVMMRRKEEGGYKIWHICCLDPCVPVAQTLVFFRASAGAWAKIKRNGSAKQLSANRVPPQKSGTLHQNISKHIKINQTSNHPNQSRQWPIHSSHICASGASGGSADSGAQAILDCVDLDALAALALRQRILRPDWKQVALQPLFDLGSPTSPCWLPAWGASTEFASWRQLRR